MQPLLQAFSTKRTNEISTLKKTSINFIYFFVLLMCFSNSLQAQLPIKNIVLTGEWKLIAIKGEYESYSYDCEKKEFYLGDGLFHSLGEAKADIFEKNIIKGAEKSFFKVKVTGDYELGLGMSSVENGKWKSKPVDESEEGFVADRFGYLVLTSNAEEFDALVIIEGQQLFFSVSIRPDGGLSQTYIFRKDFKGNAFK